VPVLFQGRETTDLARDPVVFEDHLPPGEESMSSNAFAELNASGDKIEVYFRYNADLVHSIKAVPGARFVPPDSGGPMWTVPLNLDVARRLQEELGDRLVLGRALKVWGKEAVKREKNLHSLASIDSVDAKDLELNKKIPALAEWFRGYQRADVKFLAATSCMNLNEQGLGKTTEIIGALFEAGIEHGPHLVVAPKTSLETVWRMEIERWTAELDKPHEVITYSGELPPVARQKAIDEFWNCIDEEWPVWFVCTPNTVRDGKEPFMDPKEFPDGWASFTIDEYHKTGLPNASGKKGTGTKFADSVREIPAQRRYAVTGTPMGGRPIKLWGALHFLYPDQFTSKWQWAKTWLNITSNGYGQEIGLIQKGREDEFYKALAPYVVRRLKSEVLPQLPPKQYVDVWCDMSSKQKAQYDAMAAKAEVEIEEKKLNALGILAQYTRLKVFADAFCSEIQERQVPCDICNPADPNPDCHRCAGSGLRTVLHPIPSSDSGKLPYLWERLNEAGIDPDDPSGDACAIIASQFKGVADMVHKWLNDKGIHAEKITGDTTGAERARIQGLFQEGGEDAPRVVVMTTTAGGVSITLDRADTVHILDETWVPDDQEQFADRAHRASRMHQVTVYTYRSLNTVEEYIKKLVDEKADVNVDILDLRRNGFRANMKREALNVE
jgi:SNF2 family DNA or RNA helicase